MQFAAGAECNVTPSFSREITTILSPLEQRTNAFGDNQSKCVYAYIPLARDPNLSRGPAHRYEQSLCATGVVVPLFPLSRRTWPLSRERPKRRAGSVKRRVRGRRGTFPSNGGAVTSRRRVLSAAAHRRAVRCTFQRLPVGGGAPLSAVSAGLRPSLPTLSCPRSPRATSRRDPSFEAQARGRGDPAGPRPPRPWSPPPGGTMLESIRVTGECRGTLAPGLAGRQCAPGRLRRMWGGSASRPPGGRGNGRRCAPRALSAAPQQCGARWRCSGSRENSPFSFCRLFSVSTCCGI